MEEGSSVWIRDDQEAWVLGGLVSVNETKVVVRRERDGEELEFHVGNDSTAKSKQEQTNRNTSNSLVSSFPDVKLCNKFEEDGQGFETIHDLTKLTHLHEPAILHALTVRFNAGNIYTATGPILIAVNPFKEVPLYSEEILSAYFSQGLLKLQGQTLDPEEQLPPHIFSVGDAAYRALADSGNVITGEGSENQSILISGESGSGKTESTKYIMRYLATVAREESGDDDDEDEDDDDDDRDGLDSSVNKSKESLSSNDNGEQGGSKEETVSQHIADQVLQSNPILESFGNARTTRNDNSSRFGKFIEMQFDANGKLIGAQILTYLLEKVRLVDQGEGERNFHIFYQLLKGASDEDRQKWRLPTSWHDCEYTNHSNCFERQDGVDDASQYQRMNRAFDIMGFSEEEKSCILRTISCILRLGMLHFKEPGLSSSSSSSSKASSAEDPPLEIDDNSKESLEIAASLLSVEAGALLKALVTRKIVAAGETYYKSLPMKSALDARNALAKSLYSWLFDWIVQRVNMSITSQAGATPVSASTSDPKVGKKSLRQPSNRFIGVLDIFGFEAFKHNSFEQLCINYTNETLQQQFNQFVFKLEQKEYENEGIEWSFVDFPDNQGCLDLIEGRPFGLLVLLDEQCLFPQGNDDKLANKFYDKLSDNEFFDVSRAQKVNKQFVVNHYAGPVCYSTEGFCAKNRDELHDEGMELVKSSQDDFISELCPDMVDVTQSKSRQSGRTSMGSTSSGSSSSSSSGSSSSSSSGSSSSSSSGSSGSGSRAEKRKSAIQSSTVGSQFKGQLNDLLTTIKRTAPHYVRCLKPNDENLPNKLVRTRIVDQLRYGGVLEAVKVARAGYPTRLQVRDFVKRYFMLSPGISPIVDEASAKSTCNELLHAANLEYMTHFQVGKTKIFLRKDAYEQIEGFRSKKLKAAAVRIQSVVRMGLNLRRFASVQRSNRLLQRIVRGFIARRRVQHMREERSALKLTAMAQRFIQRCRFLHIRNRVVQIQSWARGVAARHYVKMLIQHRAATSFQSVWRKFATQRTYRTSRRAAIRLQCAWRVHQAKAELRSLRIKSREVGSLQERIEELKAQVKDLNSQLSKEREKNKQILSEVAVAGTDTDVGTGAGADAGTGTDETNITKSAAIANAASVISTSPEELPGVMEELRKLRQENSELRQAASPQSSATSTNLFLESHASSDESKVQEPAVQSARVDDTVTNSDELFDLRKRNQQLEKQLVQLQKQSNTENENENENRDLVAKQYNSSFSSVEPQGVNKETDNENLNANKGEGEGEGEETGERILGHDNQAAFSDPSAAVNNNSAIFADSDIMKENEQLKKEVEHMKKELAFMKKQSLSNGSVPYHEHNRNEVGGLIASVRPMDGASFDNGNFASDSHNSPGDYGTEPMKSTEHLQPVTEGERPASNQENSRAMDEHQLTARIETMSLQLLEAENSHHAEINRLKGQLKEREEKMQKLEAELESLKKPSWTEHLFRQTNKKALYQAQDTFKENRQLKAKINELNERIQELETQNLEFRNDKEELNEQITSLKVVNEQLASGEINGDSSILSRTISDGDNDDDDDDDDGNVVVDDDDDDDEEQYETV